MASADRTAIALDPSPRGTPAVRLTWNRGALESSGDGERGGAPRSPWQVEDEIDWEQAEALRLISVVFEDGRALAIAAVRPRGAAGHDADAIEGVLLPAEGDGERLDEALISVEYGPDGKVRRVGLELYETPEARPLRVAADADGSPIEFTEDGVSHGLAPMTFRMDGQTGTGLFEALVRG